MPRTEVPTVVITYVEHERNLLWTEEIKHTKLVAALRDARSRGETARAAAIYEAQEKLAKEPCEDDEVAQRNASRRSALESALDFH